MIFPHRFKLLVVAICMTGCSMLAQTPPLTNQIEAASKAVQELAVQINHLQKTANITVEQEAKYLDKLAEVNNSIRIANTLAVGCKPDCTQAENQLQAVNEQLKKMQLEVKQ